MAAHSVPFLFLGLSFQTVLSDCPFGPAFENLLPIALRRLYLEQDRRANFPARHLGKARDEPEYADK